MACHRNPPSEKIICKKKKNLRIHPEKREKEEKKTVFSAMGRSKMKRKGPVFF